LPASDDIISQVVVVNEDILPFTSLEALEEAKLRGRHNLKNCAFVYSLAKRYGITDEAFVASLQTYQPLPHRLEFIGNKDGVDYYDDSISTTAQSAISAVESIPNAATLLLGGMDRGIDYTELVDFLAESSLSHVICMYESGKRIYEMQEKRDEVKPVFILCENLEEAVEAAQTVTPAGSACILSPAAASYGHFRDFEERGEAYKRLVSALRQILLQAPPQLL
jgi:UDP-N-acetylmuramoylalanine--D-glutamate ligase